MGVFSTDAINDEIDGALAAVSHLSVHTAWSATGANEVVGGTPLYARQPVTWTAAVSRTADNSNQQTWDIPAVTTVRFIGFWTALTGGTFYGMVPLGSSVQATCSADSSTNTLTSVSHGFNDNDTVVVLDLNQQGTPTGITEGAVYHVINSTTNTFQISTTQGGSAVNFSTDEVVGVFLIVEQSFSSQDTLVNLVGQLDVVGVR